MKEKIGEVFSVAKDNAPIPGCTVSREVMAGTSYYSLAEDTDISAERTFRLTFVKGTQ